ncbi:MAG: transferrin-binding protein-like solute binding protein, partial [Pollutimonas bauzanensis]
LRQGQWSAGPSNGVSAVWAFGNFTPEDAMPISGTVNYTGLAATYTGESTLANKSNNVIPSTAAFSVDFANKAFAGTITAMDSSIDEIALGGRVAGNTFVGTKDGFVTQGHFLGPGAEEMAGVYVNNDTLVQGAFGVSK